MSNKKSNAAGFTYIEVMIAVVILMVGILAMLSALMANLVRSYESEKRVIAKQYALSTVESIISAKEINNPGVIQGWLSVRNIITPAPAPPEPNGIFMTGFNPIREEMGWDGVAGTIDDACAATGPCIVTGRTTNTSAVLPEFERQIVITDLDDPERPFPEYPIKRRQVQVNIRFFVNQLAATESITTIIAEYEN